MSPLPSIALFVVATSAAFAPSQAAPPPAKKVAASSTKRGKAEAPARYAQAVRQWHARDPKAKAPRDGEGRLRLALLALNTGERIEISALDDDGTFAARDLDRLARVMRDSASGAEHPVDPRLAATLYRLQRRFDAPELRLVSGFRPGRATGERGPARPRGSNHGLGRAADIIVPGVRDDELAKAAREIGFVGVGVYPTSGFVHVDVRDHSYFWVDRSGPGKRNRERGILPELAGKSDARARARGDGPTLPLAIELGAGHAPTPQMSGDHDDDTDDE